LPSPTSGSLGKVVQAPPWLARLLTPWIARQVARGLSDKYPGLGPQEIADKMRADFQQPPTAEEARLLEAVVSRLPKDGMPSETTVEKPVSAGVLLAANLIPVAGVLLWGWSVFALLALFWMENVIIGGFFALRMLCADPRDAALWAGKLFMVPFFCFHYGMFTAIHGVFVLGLFGGRQYNSSGLDVLDPAMRAADDWKLWLPLLALLASHLFSFFYNYLYRGEFRRASVQELMMKPYVRVVILHVTILFGGFGAMALGSPLWALLLLIAIKITVDVKAHLKEHTAVRIA
jgi:Family of unknown function (DUF6498)